MTAPLDGLLVLDFSTLLPGPLATLMLAEAGAEVIKIERPGGEEMRRYVPRWGAESVNFAMLNRGKKSLVLDLKQDSGRARLRPLLERADILVEQFRPGVMARLGLDAEAVRAVNPRIVYCSITGFGQTGPKRDIAAHDLNYIGETGVLSLSMGPEDRPVVPPVLMADIAAGAYPAVMNILLALRQRDVTGEGATLDVAMADNLFPFMFWAIGNAQAAGLWPKNGGDLVDRRFAPLPALPDFGRQGTGRRAAGAAVLGGLRRGGRASREMARRQRPIPRGRRPPSRRWSAARPALLLGRADSRGRLLLFDRAFAGRGPGRPAFPRARPVRRAPGQRPGRGNAGPADADRAVPSGRLSVSFATRRLSANDDGAPSSRGWSAGASTCLRHGEVAYFDADGRAGQPAQRAADGTRRRRRPGRRRTCLNGEAIDRAVTSGLPRTPPDRGAGARRPEHRDRGRGGACRDPGRPVRRCRPGTGAGMRSPIAYDGRRDRRGVVRPWRNASPISSPGCSARSSGWSPIPDGAACCWSGTTRSTAPILCWAAGTGLGAMAAFEQDYGGLSDLRCRCRRGDGHGAEDVFCGR